jgi:hypothetical protein
MVRGKAKELEIREIRREITMGRRTMMTLIQRMRGVRRCGRWLVDRLTSNRKRQVVLS